jgi:transposase
MLGPPRALRRDELFLTSLEQRLPAANFYRQLDAKLDLSFVREWAADKYAEGGRPSIDPVVFFRLQLILFFEGLRSERKLMETVDLHVAHRWFLGYGFEEPLPDHSSLTRIRQRLGLATFQRLFERVVELCQEAGLVWGKELFFDGTKVRANADFDSLTPRFAQAAREHVAELFGGDASAEAAGGAAVAEPTTLPGDAAPPATGAAPDAITLPAPQPGDGGTGSTPRSFSGDAATDERLAAENQAAWKLLEERRLDPQRPPSGSGGYRRITDFRVSTTDPDAAPLNKDGSGRLGYHDHFHEKAGGCQAGGGGPERPSRLPAPIVPILPPYALSKFRNRRLVRHRCSCGRRLRRSALPHFHAHSCAALWPGAAWGPALLGCC